MVPERAGLNGARNVRSFSSHEEKFMEPTKEPVPQQAVDKRVIRPFRATFPESELTELRARIKATRWPDRETVKDATQGVQLDTMQALARYWADSYDWHKVEARLNDLPNFITEI